MCGISPASGDQILSSHDTGDQMPSSHEDNEMPGSHNHSDILRCPDNSEMSHCGDNGEFPRCQDNAVSTSQHLRMDTEEFTVACSSEGCCSGGAMITSKSAESGSKDPLVLTPSHVIEVQPLLSRQEEVDDEDEANLPGYFHFIV